MCGCNKPAQEDLAPRNTVCDVCRLVDNDLTIKWCEHCTACKAWICDPCRPRMERRAMAMYYRLTRKP